MKWIWFLLFVTLVKSDRPYLNILQYENVTIADTDTVCQYFQGAKVSEKCGEQLEIVCADTTLLMTILDASSKFPYPGLGFSSRIDYGNFDQCLTVDQSYDGGRILGEFCAIGLVIPDIFGNTTDINSFFKLAVCRPNGCSASDYNAILSYLLSQVGEEDTTLGLFLDQSCSTVESNTTFSAGDIAVLTVFGVIIFLMVISTLYDLYLYHFERKSIHPLYLAFSILTNGRKLLHISKHTKSKEQIEVFHGIRVISIMWVVAGHGMSMWQYGYVTNVEAVASWMSHLSAFHMTAAPLAVDTFFYMSGFLLAFQYFKGRTGTLSQQVKSVPHMIVHRYLRLTPAMIMVYLLTITFYTHLGNGPLFSTTADTFGEICKKYWWRFLLYIQNYYDFNDICLIQTWYLSADMQMFLISPLILIPVSLQLKKYGFKSTMWALLVLNIFFTFLPMVLKLAIREYKNDYDTHSRLINYFIGVMLGIFMRIKIDKPFLYMMPDGRKFTINLTTWIVIVLGMLAVTLCLQEQQMNHGFESRTVFDALMRPAWCIGLSWITYSCYHGYGGFVNWILCRPIFQVLGRLTYCIYLVHISVIMYVIGTSRTKWYFTEYNTFYQFCGDYIVSVFVATFWTLAFESPLIIIEKFVLGRPTARAKDEHPQKVANIEEGANAGAEKREILSKY